jgi:DNA-binding GntR family transcriptional regulator
MEISPLANKNTVFQSTIPVAAPVREHVLRALREAIVSGALAPGQKLVEADLCAQLGVSRPSVREALRQLEAERLVRITPYKGPAVAEMTWAEAAEIYEARELLEGHAAFLFAQRASDDNIKQMYQAMKEFEHAAGNHGESSALLDLTKSFYDVILAGCANQVIADVLVGLFARVNLLRSRSMSLSGRAKHSARELRKIYVAIKARDPEAARAAAVAHVRNARDAAQKALNAQPADRNTLG